MLLSNAPPDKGDVMGLSDCRFIQMPKISDVRGNLTFIESGNQIPFDITRVRPPSFRAYSARMASG